MFYSEERILKTIGEGNLVIEPFSQKSLGPISYELHLGKEIIKVSPPDGCDVYDGSKPKDKNTEIVEIGDDGYILNPGDFALANTEEIIKLGSKTTGFFDNKASLAQIGLFVDTSSKLVDPGFEGSITCELYNASTYPIKLCIGQKIGQIIFAEVE